MSLRDLCTNAECLLQDQEVGSEFIARLLLRSMASQDISEALGGRRAPSPQERCVRCLQRVMRDQAPFPTVEQWREDVRQGHRLHRRLRRHSERRGPGSDFEPPFR